MNILLFLLLSAIVIYLFVEFYPWGGRPLRPFPQPQKRRGRIPLSLKKTKPEPEPEPSRSSLDLHNLNVGDVVSYLHRDFLVVELRDVQENDWTWRDYTLEDGEDIAQLSVGEEGEEIFLLEPTHSISLTHPPQKAVRFQTNTYRLTSTGKAQVKETQEYFRYYTYQDPSGRVLIAEDWDGQYDVYVGESILPTDLQFLPGSPDNLEN